MAKKDAWSSALLIRNQVFEFIDDLTACNCCVWLFARWAEMLSFFTHMGTGKGTAIVFSEGSNRNHVIIRGSNSTVYRTEAGLQGYIATVAFLLVKNSCAFMK